jgi:hypothetical protein
MAEAEARNHVEVGIMWESRGNLRYSANEKISTHNHGFVGIVLIRKPNFLAITRDTTLGACPACPGQRASDLSNPSANPPRLARVHVKAPELSFAVARLHPPFQIYSTLVNYRNL